MAKKFSPEERLRYINDKLIQINTAPDILATTCHLTLEEVNKYLVGTIEIDNKAWIQLGIGLGKLAKEKGIPGGKELAQKSGSVRKRHSQTSIMRQVEKLDFFDGEEK
ncbi:MAG: hypothetical protein COA79_08970 [Planctomycetota bacterium]|nr:MAG: hypothetical protein COA79_08970 [Planctomycetota bacterium]